MLTDLTNQEGVGHTTYQPDYQAGRHDGAGRENREANSKDGDSGGGVPAPTSPSTGSGPATGDAFSAPGGSPSTGPAGGGQGSAGGGGSGGSGGAAGAGGAGGASAAEVAEVAVVAL